nr:hypothetical protein [Marinomonas pontica]
MIQVEQMIASKSPQFFDKSPLITRPTLSVLKRLFHESEVNQFLEKTTAVSASNLLIECLITSISAIKSAKLIVAIFPQADV